MIDEAMDAWVFVRTETRELLGTLKDEQLQFTPQGEKWQPLYYQFACMIRTQHIYAKALTTRVMDFAYFADSSFPDKHSLNSKAKLTDAFEAIVPVWKTAITTSDTVQWPEGVVSTVGHVYRLIAHERLHHGQLISYFTLAGYELSSNFKQNWTL